MQGSEEILKYLHADLIAKLATKGLAPEPIQSRSFWLRLLQLLRSDSYTLNIDKGPIVFIVSTKGTGGAVDALDAMTLKSHYENGLNTKTNVFYVDYQGKIIVDKGYMETIFPDLMAVTEDSGEKGGDHFHIFVKGNEIQFISKQIVFHSIGDVFSLNRVGAIKGTLPVDKYRTLIDSHFKKEVVGERGFSYWSNKSEWKLVASPEEQFRKRLMHFIADNVSGGYVDEECFNAGTKDRTDIRMIELITSKVYLIEVKWVGKGVGADYDGQNAHNKANEGINQLETYVKNNDDCIKGILVVYDARKDKLDIIWNPDKTKWDARIDADPFLLALDPTSASDKAKKIVSKLNKEAKNKK